MTNQKPIKKFKVGNFETAIWLNEKVIEGNKVGFKTASLRRFWKDKEKDIWRDEVIHLRKQDLPKTIVLLNKTMEELLLNSNGDENEEG